MSASRLPPQILRLLEENGTLTAVEITRFIGEDRRRVGEAISRMAVALQRTPKRIHIDHWTREAEGARKYLRPAYALGDKPDAPKIKPLTRDEIQKVAGANRRRRVQTNFVFNLGLGANRLLAEHAQRRRAND